VVNFYQKKTNISSVFKFNGNILDAPGNESIKLLCFEVSAFNGDIIKISSGVEFEVVFINYCLGINLDVTFELYKLDDFPVYHGGKIITTKKDSSIGKYTVKGVFPENLLNAGHYKFKLIFGENQRIPLYVIEDVVRFEILNEAFGSNTSKLPGVIRPILDYKLTIDSNLLT
jgi:lipopolysaccharide transport system ATP-binding protein